jgi:hypothetical protein
VSDLQVRPSWWRRRKWWKIGFFIMVVLFEISREMAVINADTETDPKIAVAPTVWQNGPVIRAEGRWMRLDEGSRMIPSATVIDCDANREECVEATADMSGGYLGAPTLDRFVATFSPDAVSYENANPICSHYHVRIDLKLKKVFAVRDLIEGAKSPLCHDRERRVEMTLGDGYQPSDNPFGDHWVPMLRSIRAMLR